jgi:hypothetical protein
LRLGERLPGVIDEPYDGEEDVIDEEEIDEFPGYFITHKKTCF